MLNKKKHICLIPREAHQLFITEEATSFNASRFFCVLHSKKVKKDKLTKKYIYTYICIRMSENLPRFKKAFDSVWKIITKMLQKLKYYKITKTLQKCYNLKINSKRLKIDNVIISI